MPTLDARQAERVQVVKGVLVQTLTLDQGAARLGIDRDVLERLVEGCRARVIATLGEDALLSTASR